MPPPSSSSTRGTSQIDRDARTKQNILVKKWVGFESTVPHMRKTAQSPGRGLRKHYRLPRPYILRKPREYQTTKTIHITSESFNEMIHPSNATTIDQQ